MSPVIVPLAQKRGISENPNPPSDPPRKGDRGDGGAGGACSAGGSTAGSSRADDGTLSTTRKRITDENDSKRSQSKRGRTAKDCELEVLANVCAFHPIPLKSQRFLKNS